MIDLLTLTNQFYKNLEGHVYIQASRTPQSSALEYGWAGRASSGTLIPSCWPAPFSSQPGFTSHCEVVLFCWVFLRTHLIPQPLCPRATHASSSFGNVQIERRMFNGILPGKIYKVHLHLCFHPPLISLNPNAEGGR